MRIVDSHFHWYPRSVFEELVKRTDCPRAHVASNGGYTLEMTAGKKRGGAWGEWFDFDALMAHENKQGYECDVILSTGPASAMFSEVDAKLGLHLSQMWNDEMIAKQRKYAGHAWASGVLPFQDEKLAMDELERCIKLGLIGVNIPGSVGATGRIDDPRLEPFYDRMEQSGMILFMHPTDVAFSDILDGYNGALYNSLGRVIDVSVAMYRLVLSGVMERHPNLKVFVSHTGGALPYQSGRMDKNSKAAKLPKDPSVYLKRFYTDTVNPHALGVKFAIDYYGVDHVMWGDDYPCWNPEGAHRVFREVVGLSEADIEKIMNSNARKFFGLKAPEKAKETAVA